VQAKGYPLISESLKSMLTNEPLTFVSMDDAEHLRFRRMFARLFTVGRIGKLREPIQKMVDTELDRIIKKGGPVDFYGEFTLVFPSQVIALLLGIPNENHDVFQDLARDRMNIALGPQAPLEAGKKLAELLQREIDLMMDMEDPGDHIIGTLIKDQIRPGNMTVDEAVTMCRLLLVAGHETTANAIAFSLLTLLMNPLQMQELRQNPDQIHTAVEELLRYTSVPQFTSARVAREDVVIGGQQINSGEGLLTLVNIANRDPAKFENPDTVDLSREDNAHIAFGDGPHQCLGQPLARLEMEIAITTVLRRMPNLRIAVPVEELSFRFDERAYGI
jgi:cytochrome P450